jgi:ATP-dependent helicase HrpA
LLIALQDRIRHARKQLPVQPKLALLYAAIESAAPRPGKDGDRLREDLVDGALASLLTQGGDDIRSAQAFAQRRDEIGRQLFGEAMARLRLAETVLATVADIRAILEGKLIGWARANLDDMRAQLHGLVGPGFLRDTPGAALESYPRYLKALLLRGERALRDPTRDQQRMLEIKPFADAIQQAVIEGAIDDPRWQSLRWDLEELRVSLFAQELGARGGVSAKKLATRLAALSA